MNKYEYIYIYTDMALSNCARARAQVPCPTQPNAFAPLHKSARALRQASRLCGHRPI